MKELMLFGFILTAPGTLNAQASQAEQDAYRYSAHAFYKQSGLELEVQKSVDNFINREVPAPLKSLAGNAFLVAKTIQERKLNYIWTF
jgi:hypothetical protein